MNRNTGAPPPASPDEHQALAPDDPQQLELRLFERLDQFRGIPPEKGLWRELLDVAIGSAKTFSAHGLTISAAFLHHVAWALFGRTNRAGTAEITDQELANDIRRPTSRGRVTAALTVMRRLRISRPTRLKRQGARIHSLNLGGLDWPAIRRRAAAATKPPPSAGEQLELPSGNHRRPLNEPSGNHRRQHEGVRTVGQISEPIAAAGTSRATTADRRQQQHDRDQIRIDGLIPAIAARARDLDMVYDEAEERQLVASGKLTVEQLQGHADDLAAEIRERRLRRAHGPSYGRRQERADEDDD